ncbi:hypothetical protein Tco_1346231 [Tanacetum coccineum]
MRMLSQRMVRLTIPWTREMIKMMMTTIHWDDDLVCADETLTDEEEEEHPALADSVVVYPTVSLFLHLREQSLIYHHPPLTFLPLELGSLSGFRLPYPSPVAVWIDFPKSEQLPRKRLCLSTLGSRYEVEESSTARPIGERGTYYGFVSTVDAEARRQGISKVGYGIRDTWVDPAEAVPEIALS